MVVDTLRQISNKQIYATYGPSRPGDIQHSLADLSRAKEVLDYDPLVMFETGIRKTYNWYLQLSMLRSDDSDD